MKPDIGSESWFLPPPPVWYWKTRMVWLPDSENFLKIHSFVSTKSTNMTDGHTDTAWRLRPSLMLASRSKNQCTYLPQFPHRIPRHENHFNLAFFFHRQREWQVTERVKLDRDFPTLWAYEGRLEKTVENIDNNRVVSLYVVGPCLLCYFLHISAGILCEMKWQHVSKLSLPKIQKVHPRQR